MQTNMNFPTYVFATVNPGRSTKVVDELKHNSQIDIIAPVTGRWDLVLRLKPNTQRNPRDQRRTHNRHSQRLRRYAAEQEAREPDGPWVFSIERTAHLSRE